MFYRVVAVAVVVTVIAVVTVNLVIAGTSVEWRFTDLAQWPSNNIARESQNNQNPVK